MLTPETRTFRSALELRASGRTIVGRAVPFGETARVWSPRYGHVTEDFEPGSVDTSGASELMADHPESHLELPVGSGPLTERRDGVYGEWRVVPGPLGDHVLELVDAGLATDLSVGFEAKPGTDLWDERAGHVTRTGVVLDHVALVRSGKGAYSSAKVLALRSRCVCAACEARVLTGPQAMLELYKRRWAAS